MTTREDVLKKAERVIESFSDDFWKNMPTFSLTLLCSSLSEV